MIDKLADCNVYRSMNMNREISKIVVGILCLEITAQIHVQ